MMTEKHYLEQLGEELSQKLGDAIWSFAKIEWLTYEYIKQLVGNDVLELVANQNFNQRIGILEKIVRKKSIGGEVSKAALAILSEAKQLSSKRNTIVHNPWQAYIDLDAMDFVAEISKYTNPDHSYDVGDIEQFTAEAKRISKDMDQKLEALTNYSTRRR